MQTLTTKSQQARLDAIARLSNRRKVHRHYKITRHGQLKLGDGSRVITPGNYHLH